MAGNHTFKIGLALDSNIENIRAVSHLQNKFNGVNASISEMRKEYAQIASSTEDVTQLEKESIKILDSVIKKQEKKVSELQKELDTNEQLTTRQRLEIENQIRSISLRSKQANKFREELKTQQKARIEAKKQQDIEKKRAEAEKKRLGIMKLVANSVADQLKNMKSVQTLLDKELKLRTRIAKVAVGAAGKVGKTAAKVGLGVAGAAAGLAGAAVSVADNVNARYEALKSLNKNVDPKIINRVIVKTGGSVTEVVNAINRVAALVPKDKIEQAAITEVKNPGAAALLAQQKQKGERVLNQNIYDNIRKATGIQDTSAMIAFASNSNLTTRGVGQIDLMNAYAALSQAGLGEEDITRIIAGVQRSKGDKSFTEAFNSLDLSKFVYGQAKKNTLNNQKIVLSDVSDMPMGESPEARAARQTVEKLREFQLHKDEILADLLPKVLPIIEALEPVMKLLAPMINLVFKLVEYLVPRMLIGIGKIIQLVGEIGTNDDAMIAFGKELERQGEDFIGKSEATRKRREKEENDRRIEETIRRKKAELEAQKEERDRRISQLETTIIERTSQYLNNMTNNFTQTNNFTMGPNPTAMSLSQKVSDPNYRRQPMELCWSSAS